MKRTEQREWVLKFIYQDMINETRDLKPYLDNYDIDEKEKFITDSFYSYKENFDLIDSKLNEGLDKSMPKLSRIVKSVLYLSINEIYFLGIPVSVSINEAVDLTKKFSDNGDYKLVNLILGKIVRKDNR